MDFFTELASVVQDIGGALTSAFSTISGIFYDPTPTTGGLTLVGYLLLAGLAAGFIKFALNLIVRLFTRVK